MMTFKKTVTISIAFHICLFSAALLMSAGLLKGGGDLPDAPTFFVSLETIGQAPSEHEGTALTETVQEKPEVTAPEPATLLKAAKETLPVVEEEVAEEAIKIVQEETIQEAVQTDISNAFAEEIETPVQQPVAEITVPAKQHIVSAPLNGQTESIMADKTIDLSGGSTAPGNISVGFSRDAIRQISTAIERVKTYPVIARKRGIEGTVHVSFTIKEDGNPREIEILKSSGFTILDKATLRVVKKAAPYPFIEKRVEVPVAYRLR